MSSWPAAALGLAIFLPAFGTHGLNALRQELAGRLELTDGDGSRFGLVMALFQWASVAAYLLVGPLADRFGARPLLRIGVGLFLLAHALLLVSAPVAGFLGVAPWAAFAGLRALAGLAGGAITVTANALGAELYPPEQRGRSLSLVWLGLPLALVVGVPLPAWLAPRLRHLPPPFDRWFGDPYALVALVVAVAVLVLLRFALPPASPPPTATGNRPGVPATGAESGNSGAVAFSWRLNVTAFLMPLAVFELLASSAAYTHAAFGFDSVANGNLFAALGAGSVAGALVSSVIADRIGRRRCLLFAQAGFAFGTLFLGIGGCAWFVTLATLLGLVSTMRQGPFQALVSLHAGARARGRIAAQVLASAAIGGGAGQFLGSWIFDRTGIHGVALSSAAAMAVALACSWNLKDLPPPPGGRAVPARAAA